MSDIATLASRMTEAAAQFVDSLTVEQRRKAIIAFEDETERRTWYYTPTPRAGLPVLEMSPVQHQCVRRLLALGLSEAGYNHAAVIMGFEYLVDYSAGFPDRTYGALPGTRVRDPGNYCVAVFGSPEAGASWGWRIGGHHLALNFTVGADSVAATPAFFGAEPARAKMPGGVLLRPLAAEEDIARELLATLTPGQRERAVISPIAATDIVQTNRPRVEEGALYTVGGTGPGGQGLRDKLGLTPAHDEMLRYTSTPKGLAAGDMDAAQRGAFERLVRTYFDHLAPSLQEAAGVHFEAGRLGATAFAWAGDDAVGAPHYYRVQGERLLIEYDCTQNDANHTHSVLRDLEGDFGADVLSQHYAAAHGR